MKPSSNKVASAVRNHVVAILAFSSLVSTGFSQSVAWTSQYPTVAINPLQFDVFVGVDKDNNVYASGMAFTRDGILESFESRTSPAGEFLWQRGPLHRYEDTIWGAVCLDKNGNTFSTTVRYPQSTTLPILLSKHDARGNLVWSIEHIEHAGEGWVHHIVVGPDGCIFVGGRTDNNYRVFKFSANGSYLWSTSFPFPCDPIVFRMADMLVDPRGNSYISFPSSSTSGGCWINDDLHLISYDAEGQLRWHAIYDGPAHGSDWGGRMDMDFAGNILIVGSSFTEAYFKQTAFVTKYDSSGNQVWSFVNDDFNSFQDIQVAADGSIYALGLSEGHFDQSTLIKLNPTGHLEWIRYTKPMVISNDFRKIDLDYAGNIYVADAVEHGVDTNLRVSRFSPSGGEGWNREYQLRQSFSGSVRSLVVDNKGDIIVTGIPREAASPVLMTMIKINNCPTLEIPYATHSE
jgi:hypothetical protein